QRKRSGKAEEIHHIIKDELGGGHVPSKRFGANAAWWTIAVLALNLHKLMKHRLLPEEYRKSRPKTIRFLLYTMVGKIVTHGRPGRTPLRLCHEETGAAAVHAGLRRKAAVP
ncbi:MAG: transposase, partial [Synergistaceae bacterium]|nr:transposase [Synergistaceae bacterium]